ncbi:hypothetical protein PEC311524_07010 [Pectobacterium carotovorum subsp. carotovorum]|nr:hypothetical protein PEC311524_07010 [Pectobacterium carotovorum subsp. carotovorum]
MQTLTTQRLMIFGKAVSAFLGRMHFVKCSPTSVESDWITNRSRNMSFQAQVERDSDGFWYFRVYVRTGTCPGNYRFEYLNTPREAFISSSQALKTGENLVHELATLRYRFQ